MAIEPKTRKMLWGRAANRCAFPDCRVELFYDITETDDAALIGEECHIIARKKNFTRGDSNLTAEQRDKYGNLILLCRNHHKIVDSTDDPYTIEALKEMKADHERWVKESLTGYDAARQRDDEVYATYVQEWERQVNLDEWDSWACGLMMHGHPRMAETKADELDSLRTWIFSRVWPQRYPRLEAAFRNFRVVLRDLLNVLNEHGEKVGPEGQRTLQVEKRQKNLTEWNEERYAALLAEYEFYVALTEDLALELTRAANLVCDEVRTHLLPNYRLQEGRVVVTSGPYSNLEFVTHLPVYPPGTDPANAYEGLEGFLTGRSNRDIHFGEGAEP